VQFAPPYIGSGSVHVRDRSVWPKPQEGHVGLHSDQLDQPPSTTRIQSTRRSSEIALKKLHITDKLHVYRTILGYKICLTICAETAKINSLETQPKIYGFAAV